MADPAVVADVLPMAPCLKRNASAELIESIRQIEARADQCFHSLKILGLPANMALWSLLVGGIHLVERESDMRGDNTAHLDATLINTSSLVSTAMKWVTRYGNQSSMVERRSWTLDLAAKVNEAIELAHNYGGFLNALPMWHKNRYGVELLSPIHARFTVIGSDTDRRVSAYQKGFRPKIGRHRSERARKIEPTAKVRELFEVVYSGCRPVGLLGFTYNDPWQLWAELRYEYNLFEIDRTHIAAKEKLPTGTVKIEVESKLVAPKPGAPMDVTLKVNGQVVAQGRVPAATSAHPCRSTILTRLRSLSMGKLLQLGSRI